MFTNFLKHTFDSCWRTWRRFKLKNRNFTIFSNDCTGGVITHQLGEPFNSPTVNLGFETSDQYVTFLEHVSDYIKAPLDVLKTHEINDNKPSFPVGILRNPQYGDLSVYFAHYSSFEQASEKWHKRCARIHLDNAFVLYHINEWNNSEVELLKRIENLPFRGKCLIIREDIFPKDLIWHETLLVIPKSFPTDLGVLLRRKSPLSQKYIDDLDYISFLNGK